MSTDDGYRQLTSLPGGKSDKVEPKVTTTDTYTAGDTVAYPPLPGPVSAYHRIAKGVADVVAAKQIAYGDSFGKSGQVLAILYPLGITKHNLQDALTVVRIIDKLFRVASRKDAFGEQPWNDIAGYALLAERRDEMEVNLKSTPREV